MDELATVVAKGYLHPKVEVCEKLRKLLYLKSLVFFKAIPDKTVVGGTFLRPPHSQI